jgi:DNA-binding NtrC family response regulator
VGEAADDDTARARAPVVWIVDSDHWPRASLRAELLERGYEAIGFEGTRDAVLALARGRPRRPDVVVVDLAGQTTELPALTALLRARAPVVGVGGALEWGAEPVRSLGWAAELHRPVTVGTIADAVEALLARWVPESPRAP